MPNPTPVQYVATSNAFDGGDMRSAGQQFRIRLPNGTQAGNCLIVAFQCANYDATPTIEDDQSNTWEDPITQWDSVNQQKLLVWHALNVAANTRVVRIGYNGDILLYFAAVAAEFNDIASATALDGSNGSVAKNGTTISAGNITPTQTGDLFFQVSVLGSANWRNQRIWSAGSQANIDWKLLTADTRDGMATQWGVYDATSVINPTMSQSATDDSVSICLALKTATQGSPRPAGLRIIGIHHLSQDDGSANPFVAQVPCLGNGLIAVCSHGGNGASWVISSFDQDSGGTWQEKGSGQNDSENGYIAREHIHYAIPHTPAPTTQVRITYNDTSVGDGNILFYDVQGLGSIQNGATAGSTGDQTSYQTTLDGAALIPTTAGSLLLFVTNQEYSTVNALSLSVGTAYFDALEYDGMSLNGPQNMDQNGGWGHAIAASTASTIPTWSFIGGDAQRVWGHYSAEFLAAGEAVSAPLSNRVQVVRGSQVN